MMLSLHAAVLAALVGVAPQTAAPAPEASPVQQAQPDDAVFTKDTPPPTTYDLQQKEEPGRDLESESLLKQLGRTLFGLLLVVGLIYLTIRVLLPRVLKMRQVTGGQSLKVLERVQLDTKHALVLIEVRGEQTLLVGTGDQGVQLISRIDAPNDARERHDRT